MTGLLFAALVAAVPTIQSAQKPVALDGDAGATSYAMSAREPLRLQLEGPGTLPLFARAQRAPGKAAGKWKLRVAIDGKAMSVAVTPGKGRSGLLSPPGEVSVPVAAGRHTLELSPESGDGFVRLGAFVSTAIAEAGTAPRQSASDPRLVQWDEDGAAPAQGMDDLMLVPLQQLVPELSEAPAGAAPKPAAAAKPAGPAALAATAALEHPQPAAKPAAFVPAAIPAPPLVTAPAPLDERLRLEPYLGFGFTQDFSLGDGTPPSGNATPQLVAGADLSWRASPQLLLTATVRDHVYHRAYLTDAPSPRGGGLVQLETGEQKVDVEIVASHELLHHFSRDGALPLGGRLELEVRGGPAARFFVNSQVPSSLSGVLAGGLVRFTFAPSLSLYASAANLYNLKLLGSYSGPSLYYGAPKSSVLLGGGVALGRAGPARLRFGYDGEVLALDRGYRQYHALTFNLDLVL